MLVQQAIFTSTVGERRSGYHLAAASPDLAEEDARDLAQWCPAHDALLPGMTSSINCHPVASGAVCVSRTAAAGAEYSQRGGARLYTQCLIVPQEGFARFANNPLRIIEAVQASGALRVLEPVPGDLPPLRIPGRAAAVDRLLLRRLAAPPAMRQALALLDAALGAPRLGIVAGACGPRRVAELLALLPVAERGAVSFSTGLRTSPRRPFRIVVLPEDRSSRLAAAREPGGLALFDPSQTPAEYHPVHPWSTRVFALLSAGRLSEFAAAISEAPALAPADAAP